VFPLSRFPEGAEGRLQQEKEDRGEIGRRPEDPASGGRADPLERRDVDADRPEFQRVRENKRASRALGPDVERARLIERKVGPDFPRIVVKDRHAGLHARLDDEGVELCSFADLAGLAPTG
jgi:hypothetical protein